LDTRRRLLRMSVLCILRWGDKDIPKLSSPSPPGCWQAWADVCRGRLEAKLYRQPRLIILVLLKALSNGVLSAHHMDRPSLRQRIMFRWMALHVAQSVCSHMLRCQKPALDRSISASSSACALWASSPRNNSSSVKGRLTFLADKQGRPKMKYTIAIGTMLNLMIITA